MPDPHHPVPGTTAPLHADLDLPLGPEAAALARRALSSVLATWHCPAGEWLDDALLVTSELVGNAVRHGGRRVALHLLLSDDALRISVSDGSSVLPQQRATDDDGESGRGMAIVRALAADWGVTGTGDGKTVWVLVPLPQGREPAASA